MPCVPSVQSYGVVHSSKSVKRETLCECKHALMRPGQDAPALQLGKLFELDRREAVITHGTEMV
jgi:hypothetical protein